MPALMDIRGFLNTVFLLLAINVVCTSSVFAAQSIDNLYEATVHLSDRSDAARRQAMAAGLEQVLIRYSGYSGGGRLSGVAGALVNAETYVIEFSVETRDVPAEDGLSVERAEALWIRYNASKVDDLIDRQQLPIWPSLRASVQYLVVQELWGEHRVMTAENHPAMAATLDTAFYERGMAALPMDSTDLDASGLWQLNEVDAYELFHQANTDVLVLVRVLPGDSFGTGAEVLVVKENGLSVYRQKSGSAIKDVFSAVNEFVDAYSLDYAFLGGSGQVADVYINVLGMDGFVEYRRFLDLISGVEQVTAARLEGFRGGQMLFRVAYGSNRERLVSALRQQTDLVEVSGQSDALGTREKPLLLAQPGYQPPDEIEPIFSPPPQILPAIPIDALSPEGEQPEN